MNWQSVFFNLVTILFVLLGIVYIYVKYIYTYWSRHGFDYLPPTFPFGNMVDASLGRISLPQNIAKLYYSTKKPFIGMFMFFNPSLIIRDPELLKQIMVKDFDHFVDRGFYCDEEKDPISAHLLALNGDKWRSMRQKVSPALTTGKLKQMIPQILNVGERLEKYLLENSTVEVKDICARCTTDVIASVAFGLEIDCLNNPDDIFRKMGNKAVAPNFEAFGRFIANFMLPKISKFFEIHSTNAEVEKFFTSIVKQMIEYRENNNIIRQDFMQMMIQIRNSGKLSEDDIWNTDIVHEKDKHLSIGQITAQAFVFFVGGFETTSSMMSYFIFEVAKNNEIQTKLRNDIEQAIQKHDNKITYESIREMKYLDMCADETLRKYPSVPFFSRQCTTDYKIPDSELIIPSGTQVLIPLYAIHNDPKYFENPSIFDPERFSPTNREKISPYVFMPFGGGPRNCVGMRLAYIQSRITLANLFLKFNCELAPNQKSELTFDPKSILLDVIGGIHIKLTPRSM